jgi:uncharacterized membrane protein YqiK
MLYIYIQCCSQDQNVKAKAWTIKAKAMAVTLKAKATAWTLKAKAEAKAWTFKCKAKDTMPHAAYMQHMFYIHFI